MLAEVDDPRIAVHVVWIPVWGRDVAFDGKKASGTLTDARMRVWTADMALAAGFADALAWSTTTQPKASGDVPWDVVMVWGPEAKWGERPSAPAWWTSPVVDDRELATRVRALLPK
jgi:hypothetical protein